MTPGRLADTWELTDRWRVVTTTIAPTPRSLTALAFDPVTERVILYGGFEEGAAAFRETWAYDGAWTRLEPMTQPTARAAHNMVLDQRRGRIVLFGGVDAVTRNDTWEFDGATWSMVTTTSAPSPRSDFAMIYHPERASVLVIGGADERRRQLFADAWELTADGWSPAPQFDLPEGCKEHSAAWCPTRRAVVLHGGWDGFTTFADTLVHDGAGWRRPPIDDELGGRRGHSLVYSPTVGGVVSVGGKTGIDVDVVDTAVFRPG